MPGKGWNVLLRLYGPLEPWFDKSKSFFDVAAALVGCGHVSGLLMRRMWPLALMLCADRVPIESTHFNVR
jgi:hypothetical protein